MRSGAMPIEMPIESGEQPERQQGQRKMRAERNRARALEEHDTYGTRRASGYRSQCLDSERA
jgi:hypothetical protein